MNRNLDLTNWLLGFLASFLLCCVVGEIYFRNFHPQKLIGSTYMYDPYTSTRLKPNLNTTMEVGSEKHEFVTNSLGFRQDEEVAPKKRAHSKRILCTGGSTTMGDGVSFRQTYVSRLQEKARKEFPGDRVEILNTGVGGWGLQETLRFLEHYGFAYEPDVVVHLLVHHEVDLDEDTHLFYLDSKGEARDTGILTPPLLDSPAKKIISRIPFYEFLTTHSHLFEFIRFEVAMSAIEGEKNGTSVATTSMKPTEVAATSKTKLPSDEMTRALLRKMKAECDERGVKFLLVLPGDRLAEGRTKEFVKNLGWFKKEGIRFVDPHLGTDIIIPGDWHPNGEGHRQIAESIWPELRVQLEQVRDRRVN